MTVIFIMLILLISCAHQENKISKVEHCDVGQVEDKSKIKVFNEDPVDQMEYTIQKYLRTELDNQKGPLKDIQVLNNNESPEIFYSLRNKKKCLHINFRKQILGEQENYWHSENPKMWKYFQEENIAESLLVSKIRASHPRQFNQLKKLNHIQKIHPQLPLGYFKRVMTKEPNLPVNID